MFFIVIIKYPSMTQTNLIKLGKTKIELNQFNNAKTNDILFLNIHQDEQKVLMLLKPLPKIYRLILLTLTTNKHVE